MSENSSWFNNRVLKDIRFAFDLVDTEKTGSISVDELRVALQALRFDFPRDAVRSLVAVARRSLKSKGSRESHVESLEEGHGTERVSFDLFVAILDEMCSREDSESALREVFDSIKGADGMIKSGDLSKVFQRLADDVSPEEVDEMIRTTSSSGREGDDCVSVSWDDFAKIFKAARVAHPK